ncbi:hypothetical protein J2T17_003298 [Paenibacillus mucilaginosus]|uniref:hypothetical protein n=1 Tax=Paenibacillus mucilaginosus TaxID=61624 RepID=UPI003D25ADBD
MNREAEFRRSNEQKQVQSHMYQPQLQDRLDQPAYSYNAITVLLKGKGQGSSRFPKVEQFRLLNMLHDPNLQ